MSAPHSASCGAGVDGGERGRAGALLSLSALAAAAATSSVTVSTALSGGAKSAPGGQGGLVESGVSSRDNSDEDEEMIAEFETCRTSPRPIKRLRRA